MTNGQNERVYLHVDKYSCRVADTIWFKAYIMKGTLPSTLSTNLYVEVFNPEGNPVSRDLFPIFRGISVGQIRIPDSLVTGNYFLRAFTRYQLNYDTIDLFSVPLLVFNKDRPNPSLHRKHATVLNQTTSGIIDGILWATTLKGGKIYSMLAIDSTNCQRNLQLVQPVTKDSSMLAGIVLSQDRKQIYCIFPNDSARVDQELLLFEDSTLIGRQFIHLRSSQAQIEVQLDTLDLAPGGYNSWEVKFPDHNLYTASISISDAEGANPVPTSIVTLDNSRTEDLSIPIKQADTSYLMFEGKATRSSGKRIKDEFSREILLAGARDSNYLFTKILLMDSLGYFKVDSLFFFDTIAFNFQLNRDNDGSTKNIHLQFRKFTPPIGDSSFFTDTWPEDSLPMGKVDTFYSKKELRTYELAKIKTLTPVIVKGWKSPRKELDQKYTSGSFSEPAMYSFDIRTEHRFQNIGAYLRANLPGFQGGFGPSDTPIDPMGHPILFFVDEQNYTWNELSMFDWDRVAYIKCFESDFVGDDDFTRWKNGLPHGFSLSGEGALKSPRSMTPMIIAIYLRRGNDFRTMPGGMNNIDVRGYTSVLNFHPDHATILWDARLYGNSCRVHFYNSEFAKRLRVVIEGFDYKGHLVHLEKIVE
jgi:hypothetical protein